MGFPHFALLRVKMTFKFLTEALPKLLDKYAYRKASFSPEGWESPNKKDKNIINKINFKKIQ